MPTNDDFSTLMTAIAQLQQCIKSMGPAAELVEIRVRGHHEVQTAIRASPSYLTTGWYRDEGRPGLKPGTFLEIYGVGLTSVPREGRPPD